MVTSRLLSLLLAICFVGANCISAAEARTKHHSTHRSSHSASRSSHGGTTHKVSRRSQKQKLSAHRSKSKRSRIASHSKRKRTTTVAHKPRYAYPSDFFLWNAPQAMDTQLPASQIGIVKDSFRRGTATRFTPSQLLQAGVFMDDPLVGGIFKRREDVKYIVLHSTETGRPADASRVIKSWNRGLRHPGAQYVVDRDGVIHQAVDPLYGTVHVNIFRTLFGVNNDNSVGIEIVRAGDQQYTRSQLDSVTRLVVYLQNRFAVTDARILAHRQVQPSDRLDPVGFDFAAFNLAKGNLRGQTLAFKRRTQSMILPRKGASEPANGGG